MTQNLTPNVRLGQAFLELGLLIRLISSFVGSLLSL